MIEPQTATVTSPPSELLHQVAMSMSGKDAEVSVTVPADTTWKAVLHATDLALGNLDGSVVVTKPRTEEQQLRLRKMALEDAAAWNSSSSSKQTSFGLPIRFKYDISSLPVPKPASRETLRRLDKVPFDCPLYPYPVTFAPSTAENRMPVVKANIILRGIETYFPKAEQLNSVEMLWDTGAHQTIITEDLLSESFRKHLQQPIQDLYRSGDKLRVQLDAVVALSNAPAKITAIALVVPRSAVPNERIGVIFGQKHCIDCLSYRSIPRQILKAKGEDVGDEIWGDIVLDEYINEDGDMVSF